MPSHFYLPAIPAALLLLFHLAAKPHPLRYHQDRSTGSKMQVKLLLATDSGSWRIWDLLRLLVTEANFWLQQCDNVKHHLSGTHSTSRRLGYLSLWRSFGKLISELWEKKKITLLIFAEAVSKALTGFKQPILQHWEELWWKQLERWAAVWGSLLMDVGLTMQVRALLKGRRGK